MILSFCRGSSNAACQIDEFLQFGRGVLDGAGLTIEELVWPHCVWWRKRACSQSQTPSLWRRAREMLGKERNGQCGTLTRAEIEQELVVRSEKEGADHDRMKDFRDFGVRSLEFKRFGLIAIEPYPGFCVGSCSTQRSFLNACNRPSRSKTW